MCAFPSKKLQPQLQLTKCNRRFRPCFYFGDNPYLQRDCSLSTLQLHYKFVLHHLHLKFFKFKLYEKMTKLKFLIYPKYGIPNGAE